MANPTELKLHPLIPFDIVIDTDYGLIKMINERYHNKDTFHSLLLSMPDKNLIYTLYNREIYNPLYPFIKDKEDIKTMDSYYNQFIDSEYSTIINMSITTNIIQLIKLMINTEGVLKPTILCKSDKESNFLYLYDKETFSKCDIEVCYIEALNLKMYDPVFVKYYKDAIRAYRELEGRNLYVAGYNFNLINNKIHPALTSTLGNANKMVIADIYKIDDTYKAKG